MEHYDTTIGYHDSNSDPTPAVTEVTFQEGQEWLLHPLRGKLLL